MKNFRFLATAAMVFAFASAAFAGSITVGTADTGNCYPFMCNDTGVVVGQSIDYQQVYTSTAFSGVTNINSISFTNFLFGGNTITGNYQIFLGYTAAPVGGLSTNLPGNVISESLFANFSGGGSGAFTVNGSFTYDPNIGNLLLEVFATNQANVPNGSGNGYNDADDTGSVTSRAYCLSGGLGCFADNTGLVTTFGTGTTPIPEPGSLLLLGTGVLGAAGALRRKFNV